MSPRMGFGAALLPPETAERGFATGPVLAFRFLLGSGHLREKQANEDKAKQK